jgi:7-cyano-7-deazaguanine synthase
MLLSGGLDSTAIAALERPALCLFVDYGQRPAGAERATSRLVATELGLALDEVSMDLSIFGEGMLVGRDSWGSATPEWFPFRNQFLITAAAAFAVTRGYDAVLIGTVGGDGERHVDGTSDFVTRIAALVAMQEGGIRVHAPYVDVDPVEVIRRSSVDARLLRRTYSCHTGNLACGQCPGCRRRFEILHRLDSS